MVNVRDQLTFCAKNDFDLYSGSDELNNLREFNKKNQGNVDQMSEYMQAKKKEMGDDSDSDGFESVVSDGQCESYHSGEDGSD